SSYYCCTEGEVMSAAMPSSLKLASESKITLRDGSDVRNSDDLTDKELLIVEALEIHGELDIKDLTELLQQKTVMQHVKALVDKGWVISFEELKQKFKPKTEKIIGLSKEFQHDAALERAVGELERGRGHKQLDALMGFLREAKNYSVWISRKQLMESANVQSATIKALIDKGLFEIQEVEIDPFKSTGDTDAKEVTLSEDQERAKLEIQASLEEKSVCLLHGITGSGKTEVYIELIKEELGKGNQALFLIPEIALTTQLIGRLEKFFPEQIVVYHSKFNLRERTDVWKEILKGKPMLIVGARSSVFLPFHNLSLILVDEEHESSYKQYDPAPRYNARDASVVLASIHKAKVLMGSATPSIETYHNAEQGKYGLVTMNQRFGGIMLPEIMCADLRKEIKRKSLQGHFSHLLREHMEETLRAGKQIILFQNRRGYAPLWQCHTCGWVPQCTRCDVSLTYHKRAHHLNCHYCGYTIDPPVVCKVCGSRELKNLGFGTEMIEEELQEHFPEVKVARMDLDTTRSKHAYQKMLAAFEAREIDVLVGTQMISKGLDFDHVALVGILNADQMMNFPDFRSFERSYQLMTQVAGRAGRRSERGKVIIQTYKPDHWVIQKVIQGDYLGLYKQELVERINHDYPPYYRLIKITLKHKEERIV
ncbi:MAG: replication restart helicase PriA, partial [Flavobacteriales bacterium]